MRVEDVRERFLEMLKDTDSFEDAMILICTLQMYLNGFKKDVEKALNGDRKEESYDGHKV